MMSELRDVLIHSRAQSIHKAEESRWTMMVFEPESGQYVAVSWYRGDLWSLRVWAATPDMATEIFDRLKLRYLLPLRDEECGHFYIVTNGPMGPDKRLIQVNEQKTQAVDLDLNYGGDFPKWHARFVELLTTRNTGITILQGAPGTGKTSYLRHLLFETRATHRFYYLPISAYPLLVAPATVDFWIGESEGPESLTNVVVIEDAEALLVQRDAGSQESVSNLLNIADGFLADVLKLHLICTINAPVGRMDPAVTRPGRLITSRKFRRLTQAEAARLARAKNLRLEPRDDYSLAEIYNSAPLFPSADDRPAIGFAA